MEKPVEDVDQLVALWRVDHNRIESKGDILLLWISILRIRILQCLILQSFVR